MRREAGKRRRQVPIRPGLVAAFRVRSCLLPLNSPLRVQQVKGGAKQTGHNQPQKQCQKQETHVSASLAIGPSREEKFFHVESSSCHIRHGRIPFQTAVRSFSHQEYSCRSDCRQRVRRNPAVRVPDMRLCRGLAVGRPMACAPVSTAERFSLPMKMVAADVSPRRRLATTLTANSRRRLRFPGPMREFTLTTTGLSL